MRLNRLDRFLAQSCGKKGLQTTVTRHCGPTPHWLVQGAEAQADTYVHYACAESNKVAEQTLQALGVKALRRWAQGSTTACIEAQHRTAEVILSRWYEGR